jgi:hypothetical protein
MHYRSKRSPDHLRPQEVAHTRQLPRRVVRQHTRIPCIPRKFVRHTPLVYIEEVVGMHTSC